MSDSFGVSDMKKTTENKDFNKTQLIYFSASIRGKSSLISLCAGKYVFH